MLMRAKGARERGIGRGAEGGGRKKKKKERDLNQN
jgi:hypothetical protein